MVYRDFLKPLIDFIGSVVLLVLFSPVLAFIAILVRVKLGAPILFIQERPGFMARPFKIYKFRTMVDLYDDHGKLLPDKQRLTAFGKFLRSTSLDELPELINVLKGEMSLVGPRPLLMQYLERYSPEQMRRHEVKPGMTGWAQVNGRNAITWYERFTLDVWYVDHFSLLLDLRILFTTIAAVVQRRDVNQPGMATIEEFMGNP